MSTCTCHACLADTVEGIAALIRRKRADIALVAAESLADTLRASARPCKRPPPSDRPVTVRTEGRA